MLIFFISQGSGTSSSGGESSCDESRIRKPRLRTAEPRLRTTAIPNRLREDCVLEEGENSDYNSSTGEESCDTVIYVGPDGELSDRELTDHEGPPSIQHYKPSPLCKNTSPWEDCETTRSLKRKLEAIENLDLDEEDEVDGKKTPTSDLKEDTDSKEKQEYENIISNKQSNEEVESETPCDENVDETQDRDEIVKSNTKGVVNFDSLPNEVSVSSREESKRVDPVSTLVEDERHEEVTGEKLGNNESLVRDVVEPQAIGQTQDIDSFDDEYFEELQELEFLDETLDKNLVSDEEFDFQEKDFLPNFTEHPTFQNDLRFSPKNRELSEKELRETAKYALSKTESLLAVESDNIAALEEWNDTNVDIAAIMKYHKPAVVKPTPKEPGKPSKKSHTSKSSSSDASSSDAESIILPEKPCFSFMTCVAVNDESDPKKSVKRHSGSFIVSSPSGDVKCCYDVTAKLVEACQPEGYFQEGSCYMLEEQHSPDEYCYDDTELIWGEKEDDLGTVTVLYSDERGQGIEKTITRALSDDSLFADLDQKLSSIGPVDCDDSQEAELEIKLHDGSSDSPDSDQDLPPRSPAMDTPMKLFYHLVPSPHSSSNEELDDAQSKIKAIAAKSLSPIQEHPSKESSLNRSSESLSNELRDQNHNIVDGESDNIKIDAIEGDVNSSPPPKYFRTVDHDQMNRGNMEHELKPDKQELQSIIQRFVAEQLMESQGLSGEIKISRPQPRPASERVTPTRGNRRCRVISPNDSANQDMLLPPLKPHRRSMLNRSRVVCSPKLGVREREYGSDVVSYRRDYHDDSSDSSLTTRTEPWSSPIRPRPVLPTPPQQTPNITTNVTFIGCETPSPVSNVKVVAVDTDSPEETSDEVHDLKSFKHERYQEFGYQSEPEVRKPRSHSKQGKSKRDERGYLSEGESKLKNKENNSGSLVKLTYDGSEISGSEAEITRPRGHHRSEPHVGRYGNLKGPAISQEKIDPKTPYSPQADYKTRHQHHRSSHKLVYRLSGEFTAVVTTHQDTSTRHSRTSGSNSMSLLSCSPNRRVNSCSTVNSCTGLSGSTSTVWVLSEPEPALSSEEITADERSVPGTPVTTPRGRRLSRLKFFR